MCTVDYIVINGMNASGFIRCEGNTGCIGQITPVVVFNTSWQTSVEPPSRSLYSHWQARRDVDGMIRVPFIGIDRFVCVLEPVLRGRTVSNFNLRHPWRRCFGRCFHLRVFSSASWALTDGASKSVPIKMDATPTESLRIENLE